MGDTDFSPLKSRTATRRRKRLIRSAVLVGLAALAGALLDPSIIPPFGPIAQRPERITATFTRCGQGRSFACVVDGDTIRLGNRRVRMIGIDAPELDHAQCPQERALAERAANRLVTLVNAGEFDLVGHRFRDRDSHGRDLRSFIRDGNSLDTALINEGLAHRYFGRKSSWC